MNDGMEVGAVPLTRYHDVLWTVEATLAGERRPFILDTAGGLTILTPQEVSRNDLSPFGRLTGHRMSGERIDMARCDDVSLTLGPRALELETVGVFDLMGLLPPDWEPIAGLIALDVFVDQPITLDLAHHLLHLESPMSLAHRTANMTPLRMRISRSIQGLALDVFAGVVVDGRTMWFELDSGNTGPVIVSSHVAQGLELSASQDSGAAPSDAVPSCQLELAGYGPLSTDVVMKDIIYDGNLGATFFHDRVVTLDLATARLWSS